MQLPWLVNVVCDVRQHINQTSGQNPAGLKYCLYPCWYPFIQSKVAPSQETAAFQGRKPLPDLFKICYLLGWIPFFTLHLQSLVSSQVEESFAGANLSPPSSSSTLLKWFNHSEKGIGAEYSHQHLNMPYKELWKKTWIFLTCKRPFVVWTSVF